MAKQVGTFDVLKEMCSRNLDVRLSTLDNISNMELGGRKSNQFTRITIGISGAEVLQAIYNGKFVGGLLLASKEQFEQIKKELMETKA